MFDAIFRNVTNIIIGAKQALINHPNIHLNDLIF
ncbi:hypothetical protein QE439_004305 [Pedobacter agri]|nr:hypothetical protein [Pedobacter agri]